MEDEAGRVLPEQQRRRDPHRQQHDKRYPFEEPGTGRPWQRQRQHHGKEEQAYAGGGRQRARSEERVQVLAEALAHVRRAPIHPDPQVRWSRQGREAEPDRLGAAGEANILQRVATDDRVAARLIVGVSPPREPLAVPRREPGLPAARHEPQRQ